jgi:hypothetical protein
MPNPLTNHAQLTLGSALRHLAERWDTQTGETIDGMAALCPHCGAFSSFLQVNSANLIAAAIVQAVASRSLIQAKCSACKRLVVVASSYVHGPQKEQQLRLDLLWPADIRPSRSPSTLDADATRDYDQARATLPVSPMASAVLARRCLQHVIRQKLGIRKNRLIDEIDEALVRPELTKLTREALDHVRKIGNWGAHPTVDPGMTIIEVSDDEAEYTLDVLELLFHDLYDAPERIAAMNARIQSRGGR